jgi:toxin ParE1/3/4
VKGRFHVSRAAARDLVAIGRQTVGRWGRAKAQQYLTQLDGRFAALAANPSSGRSCDEIRAGYRRYLEGSHVIFYRLSKQGVVLERSSPSAHHATVVRHGPPALAPRRARSNPRARGDGPGWRLPCGRGSLPERG